MFILKIMSCSLFQSKLEDENLPKPQSIYLEGALAHESQILVADSQTKREEVYDAELNGSAEEPAVRISPCPLYITYSSKLSFAGHS